MVADDDDDDIPAVARPDPAELDFDLAEVLASVVERARGDSGRRVHRPGPGHGAARQWRGDRQGRADRHHRLPDHGGRAGLGHHLPRHRRRRPCRRLRPGHRAGPDPGPCPAGGSGAGAECCRRARARPAGDRRRRARPAATRSARAWSPGARLPATGNTASMPPCSRPPPIRTGVAPPASARTAA